MKIGLILSAQVAIFRKTPKRVSCNLKKLVSNSRGTDKHEITAILVVLYHDERIMLIYINFSFDFLG